MDAQLSDMTAQVELLFTLFLIFQVKHYLADFPLQSSYMLRKVLPSWDFLIPLIIHCSVHAAMTLVICLWFRPELWWLCLVDFTAHFFMDRIKAGDKYLGRFRDKNKPAYWNSLGFDQLVHHYTHYFIIYMIYTSYKM